MKSKLFPTVPSSNVITSSFNTSLSSPIECEALESVNNKAGEITILSKKWKKSWSHNMSKALDEPSLSPLTSNSLNIRSEDLEDIGCPNLNRATREQKKLFWIAFMSAIAVPESNHKPEVSYCEPKNNCYPGHPDVSRGLLQIGTQNADAHCPKPSRKKHTTAEIHDPDVNLRCGLYIMKHQLNGNRSGSDKNLKGRLFPKPKAYYWSVLTTSKQSQVKSFFSKHQNQLGFCTGDTTIKTPSLGENSPLTINECQNIQDTARVEPAVNDTPVVVADTTEYTATEATPFEGTACSRAMKPWSKKLPSVSIDREKKLTKFITRNNNKVMFHIAKPEFPFEIATYEGQLNDENKIFEFIVNGRSYVSDFTNSLSGILREKNKDEELPQIEMKLISKLPKSPYLMFFDNVETYQEKSGIKLSNFSKVSLESCYGAVMAANPNEKENIEKSSKKLKLNFVNVSEIAGKSRIEINRQKSEGDLAQ